MAPAAASRTQQRNTAPDVGVQGERGRHLRQRRLQAQPAVGDRRQHLSSGRQQRGQLLGGCGAGFGIGGRVDAQSGDLGKCLVGAGRQPTGGGQSVLDAARQRAGGGEGANRVGAEASQCLHRVDAASQPNTHQQLGGTLEGGSGIQVDGRRLQEDPFQRGVQGINGEGQQSVHAGGFRPCMVGWGQPPARSLVESHRQAGCSAGEVGQRVGRSGGRVGCVDDTANVPGPFGSTGWGHAPGKRCLAGVGQRDGGISAVGSAVQGGHQDAVAPRGFDGGDRLAPERCVHQRQPFGLVWRSETRGQVVQVGGSHVV